MLFWLPFFTKLLLALFYVLLGLLLGHFHVRASISGRILCFFLKWLHVHIILLLVGLLCCLVSCQLAFKLLSVCIVHGLISQVILLSRCFLGRLILHHVWLVYLLLSFLLGFFLWFGLFVLLFLLQFLCEVKEQVCALCVYLLRVHVF